LGIRYKSPERGADWVSTVEGEKSVEMKSRKLVDLMMPNVLGMGAADAVYLVEKSGLKAKINGVGRVLRQSPQPGTRCQKGQRVNLVLS
jgi:cell division protein FtsI (penicillin-binding protein 3)